MSDIPEFQAFDVLGNRMINIVGFVLAHNEIRIWYFEDEALVNESFKPSLLILRQFTSLLDKNGKKIFKDDICRITYPEGESELMRVAWDTEKAQFCFVDIVGSKWTITHTPVEVVGNTREDIK